VAVSAIRVSASRLSSMLVILPLLMAKVVTGHCSCAKSGLL
jgi:type III secretory pathway component EscT